MNLAETWADGVENFQKKTPPTQRRGRNEEICEEESRAVAVPVILEPVPIQHNLVAILVEVRSVQVVVAVPDKCTKHPPNHHSLSTLRVVSNSAS